MTAMLRRLLTALNVLLLFGLVLVPSLQIVMRTIGFPFIGSEELTRFLLICLVFTGFPLVVAHGENIVMGELKAALPSAARRVIDLLISATAIAATVFVAIVTVRTAMQYMTNATPTLKIPFWLFMSATFVGFAGAALVHIRHLRHPPQRDTNIAL